MKNYHFPGVGTGQWNSSMNRRCHKTIYSVAITIENNDEMCNDEMCNYFSGSKPNKKINQLVLLMHLNYC